AERLLLRPRQWHGRIQLRHVAKFVAGDKGERLAGSAVDFHVHRPLESGSVAGETLPQSALKLWVAGLPDFVPRVDSVEINVTTPKAEPGLRAVLDHRIDTSAFLVLVRMPGVEHHAVPGFERALQLEPDVLALYARDFPKINTTLFGKTRVDELLVIDPA